MHYKIIKKVTNTPTLPLKKFFLSLAMTSMFSCVMGAEINPLKYKSGFPGSSVVAGSILNSSTVVSFSEHANNESALDALNQNPTLFHQVSYESYTKFVAEKREEASKLWEIYKRGVECQKEIEKLAAQLETHKKILLEFGQGDRDVAIKKIDEDIAQFKINIENYKTETLSILKAKTEENKRKIEMYQSNREILNQDTTSLERYLKIARDKYSDIIGNAQLDYFKGQMSGITESLIHAYAKHTVGPMEEILLSDDIISKVLKTYENCGLVIGKLDTKKFYQLLARSLELPYYLKLSEGVSGDSNLLSEWVGHATKIKATLALRLKEDVLTLQSMLAISKRFNLSSAFGNIAGNENRELPKILIGGNAALSEVLEGQLSKNVAALKYILNFYKTDPEELVLPENFMAGLMKDYNGYFGLCVESLNRAPATSWRVFKELCQVLHSKTQVESTFKVYMKLRNGQRPIMQGRGPFFGNFLASTVNQLKKGHFTGKSAFRLRKFPHLSMKSFNGICRVNESSNLTRILKIMA